MRLTEMTARLRALTEGRPSIYWPTRDWPGSHMVAIWTHYETPTPEGKYVVHMIDGSPREAAKHPGGVAKVRIKPKPPTLAVDPRHVRIGDQFLVDGAWAHVAVPDDDGYLVLIFHETREDQTETASRLRALSEERHVVITRGASSTNYTELEFRDYLKKQRPRGEGTPIDVGPKAINNLSLEELVGMFLKFARGDGQKVSAKIEY